MLNANWRVLQLLPVLRSLSLRCCCISSNTFSWIVSGWFLHFSHVWCCFSCLSLSCLCIICNLAFGFRVFVCTLFLALILPMLSLLLSKWINGSSSRDILYGIYPYYLLCKIPTFFDLCLSLSLFLSFLWNHLLRLFTCRSVWYINLKFLNPLASSFGVFHSFSSSFSDLLFLLLASNAHLLACSRFFLSFLNVHAIETGGSKNDFIDGGKQSQTATGKRKNVKSETEK